MSGSSSRSSLAYGLNLRNQHTKRKKRTGLPAGFDGGSGSDGSTNNNAGQDDIEEGGRRDVNREIAAKQAALHKKAEALMKIATKKEEGASPVQHSCCTIMTPSMIHSQR